MLNCRTDSARLGQVPDVVQEMGLHWTVKGKEGCEWEHSS